MNNTVRLSICIPKDLHDQYTKLRVTGFKLSTFVQEILIERINELANLAQDIDRGRGAAKKLKSMPPLDIGFIKGAMAMTSDLQDERRCVIGLRKKYGIPRSIEFCIGYFKQIAEGD